MQRLFSCRHLTTEACATSQRAIVETLVLARRAEALGYCRYWLAEHHAIAALADPCPEVLLARLGAETSRMRIGTGGALLGPCCDRRAGALPA